MRATRDAIALATVAWITAITAATAAVPPLPHDLPPPGAHAASGAAAPRWIVGFDGRRGRLPALAERLGARVLPGLAAYLVDAGRARELAGALRAHRALSYSEPDLPMRSVQSGGAGSLRRYEGWRRYIVEDGLTVPPPGPLLALVDSQAQVSHPAFATSHISSDRNGPLLDFHGTATIAVAAAGDTGLGFQGIYPGARAVNLASGLTCADVSRGVLRAIRLHAAVLNLSFGSRRPCYLLYATLMAAVAHDVLLVAAAGNEFLSGNPLSYPAAFPHVLTVGAIAPDLTPSFFSSASLAVDVGAPGQGLLVPVPVRFDTDGDRDGYAPVSGTSFAAPMVAGMADWIRAVRPALNGEQVADDIRLSAHDIYRRGYDTDTGYGLPRLGAALIRPAPPRRLLEPNDDIGLVDGRLFGRPHPAVWRGRGRRVISGQLDAFKNPADVFRLVVRAHSRVRITLRVLRGRARVAAFSFRARSTAARPLARTRVVSRTVDLRLVNRHGPSLVYLEVRPRSLAAAYRLTIRRGR